MGNQKVLLVEGKDDLYVIADLLKYHLKIDDVKKILRIKDKEGIENLLESIPDEIRASGIERIGIVVDADTDIDARWQAVCNRLKILNIVVQNTPEPDGTIFNFTRADDQEIRIGIWIMPDNNVPGILENFVSFLIPAKDLLWDRAQSCVDQIPKEEFSFNVGNKDLSSWDQKAKIHTWLAWQKQPGIPFGTAIAEKALDPDSPYADNFLNWLKILFDFNKPDIQQRRQQ